MRSLGLIIGIAVSLALIGVAHAEDNVTVSDEPALENHAPDTADTPQPTPSPKMKEATPKAPFLTADRASRDEALRLVQELGSERWQVRENASEQLVKLAAPAVSVLEQTYESSQDPEIRQRAMRAIIAIRESAIAGVYTQISSQTTDGAGNLRPGDSHEGWLTIRGGKAIWCQRYGETVTSQTYSFDLSATIEVKDGLEIKLTFEELESMIGYSAESNNPKLTFTRDADGQLKVTFIGTDGMNQTSHVQFSPKTDRAN